MLLSLVIVCTNFLVLISLSEGISVGKENGRGYLEKSTAVYCTSDWICNTYCSPDRVAYCSNPYKMGPDVKYGTCFCCDSHVGYFEQSSYGCSSTCSQVYIRVMTEARLPQACPDKNSNSYFGALSPVQWFGGTNWNDNVKKEMEDNNDNQQDEMERKLFKNSERNA